jgi:hypothetical protein
MLLFFRSHANLTFDFGITDYDKMPTLLVGTARGVSRHAQAIFDHLPWNGTRRKLAHGSASEHFIAKRFRTVGHLLGRKLTVSGKR